MYHILYITALAHVGSCLTGRYGPFRNLSNRRRTKEICCEKKSTGPQKNLGCFWNSRERNRNRSMDVPKIGFPGRPRGVL